MSAKLTKLDTVQRRLLPYSDAAVYLGLSVKTLRNWVSLNRYPELKPKRLGGKPLFDLRELDKFCDSLQTEGPR